MRGLACAQVNHVDAAARLRLAALELLAKGQVREHGVSWHGKADDCEGPRRREAQPTREAWEPRVADEGLLGRRGVHVDPSKPASAGLEEPKLPLVHPRRVRHAEPRTHNRVRPAVPYLSSTRSVLSPAVFLVGWPDDGSICELRGVSRVHAEAVEVAAVLGAHGGEERWHPHGRKRAARRVELCHAVERRARGQHATIRCLDQLVGVNAASEVRLARCQHTVPARAARVGEGTAALAQCVCQTVRRCRRRYPQVARRRR
mmetsp:Transcript_697/g.2721  ORF Transcript_697/g.2721 Transcript_697/m.2721 type:complete len:260 (-) Transcript_697:341-1120(-)